jgi:hypothetical protein
LSPHCVYPNIRHIGARRDDALCRPVTCRSSGEVP